MKRIIILITIVIYTLFSTAACYEDSTVTLYEPHVYKGKQDVHEDDAVIRAEKLKTRFSMVQTDR